MARLTAEPLDLQTVARDLDDGKGRAVRRVYHAVEVDVVDSVALDVVARMIVAVEIGDHVRLAGEKRGEAVRIPEIVRVVRRDRVVVEHDDALAGRARCPQAPLQPSEL